MFNFNSSINQLSDEEIILLDIEEFNVSPKRQLMLDGQKYYEAENDILQRQILVPTDDNTVEVDESKANNKLVHAFMKNLVDEKVAYLLSKPFSLDGEDTNYIDKVKAALGKDLQYDLSNTGTEASNKGLSWWYVYINSDGKFAYMQIPTEQCVPIWTDNSHKDLQAMIRYYIQIVYQGRIRTEVTKVEYYTSDSVSYYVLDGNELIYDIAAEPEGGPVPHYKQGEEGKSWGKVPFIAFKNNPSEIPDLKYVKTLIDDYDLRRSDISNILEECKNYITVLKNYGGQDLAEFLRDLNYYRAIKIDDDGGVDTLTPDINIDAAKLHIEQTKRDINEFGQSVTKDLDKIGSSPSGVALKFLYSGLDLKCNKLELEFKRAWNQLLYFVNIYLSDTSQGNYSNSDLDIVFSRDIVINENDTINNCSTSEGIISSRTIVANHPWVKDVDKELKQLDQEQKKKIQQNQAAFQMPMNTDTNTNSNNAPENVDG
ncbi:phage portal protein [Clostridium sp. 19966]|uniref:phage portal protein n=1 Tax=Clostridium sp. 19966 TaxID=2768166 RepID=UPI0028E0450D|nr:phage portal protein [Clostridium sp. 19966]MDT8715450.1 phage portal protein [Clostridium sp. 19966]